MSILKLNETNLNMGIVDQSKIQSDTSNALDGIETVIVAAKLLENSAYEMSVVMEPAKVANLIKLSAYLMRFADRCKNDVRKASA